MAQMQDLALNLVTTHSMGLGMTYPHQQQVMLWHEFCELAKKLAKVHDTTGHKLRRLASVGRQTFLTRMNGWCCSCGCKHPVFKSGGPAQGGTGESGHLAALASND